MEKKQKRKLSKPMIQALRIASHKKGGWINKKYAKVNTLKALQRLGLLEMDYDAETPFGHFTFGFKIYNIYKITDAGWEILLLDRR